MAAHLSEANGNVSTGQRASISLVDALSSETEPCIIWVPRRFSMDVPGSVRRTLGEVMIGAFAYADLLNGKYKHAAQIEGPDYSYIPRIVDGHKRIFRSPNRPAFNLKRDIDAIKTSPKTKNFVYSGNYYDMLQEFRKKGYRQKFLLDN